MKRLFVIVFISVFSASIFGQTSYIANILNKSVLQTNNIIPTGIDYDGDNAIIGGATFTTNPDMNYTATVIKSDPQGNIIWQWQGSSSTNICGIGVLPNGEYVMVLNENANDYKFTTYLALLSHDGTQLEKKVSIDMQRGTLLSINYATKRIAVTADYGNVVKIFDYNLVQRDLLTLNPSGFNQKIWFHNNTLIVSGMIDYYPSGWNWDGDLALYKKSDGSWRKQWEKIVYNGNRGTFTVDTTANQIYFAATVLPWPDTYVNSSCYLAKYDMGGDSIWIKNYQQGSEYYGFDMFTTITLLPEEKGILVSGLHNISDEAYLGNNVIFDTTGTYLNKFMSYPENVMLVTFNAHFNQDRTVTVIYQAADANTSQLYIENWSIDGITDIKPEPNRMPSDYTLYQNYPNPFNPTTTISYSIPQPSFVTIKIYDILGREVATLVDHKYMSTGDHEVKYYGLNFPSGTYLYRIIAGSFIQTNKMLLLK